MYYAKKIIDEKNFDKIIIVSDPLHMKRSTAIAKDFGLHVYSSPTPTTKYVSWKTKTEFLLYETFFYIAHTAYKYFYIIVLYLFIFECLFFVYYHSMH